MTVLLPLVMTGCSASVNAKNEPAHRGGGEAAVLDVGKARAKANHLSSQIYDLLGLKEGKVAGGGAGVSACDEDPGHLYRMRHPWSVYQVAPEKLEAGFRRLREALPRNGWKIVEDGHDTSANKNPQLTADSEKEPFSVNVSLHVTGPSGTAEPMIQVRVVSGCYRAPEGTDLDKEY